jgi:1,4-dihydroxy-2-naphthoate octaprenyltransferase
VASLSEWVEGARPRTLPLSISPVVAAGAVTLAQRSFDWRLELLALIVGVSMQVGVNFSNDYSDGVRGTDEHRVGPQRLVGSGAAAPGIVKLAAFSCFGIGALAGLGMIAISGHWWLVLVGVAIIAGAWFYTGGKHPYGYLGLGEVFVFIFFGPVAVCGTTYVQTGVLIDGPSLAMAVANGFGSCAVLVANNLRDIPSDAAAGKLTLSVRIGDHATRIMFVVFCAITVLGFVAFALLSTPWALLSLLVILPMYPGVHIVLSGATGLNLILVLKLIGIAALVGASCALAGVVMSQTLFA